MTTNYSPFVYWNHCVQAPSVVHRGVLLKQALVAAFLWLVCGSALANSSPDAVQKILSTVISGHSDSASSQARIDKLDDAARALLQRFRIVTRQQESLAVYNEQLETLIESQVQEMRSIKQQIQQIDVTDREITPLMLSMVDTLARFIALDMPFLPDERSARVASLRSMLTRADIALGEKYRRVLEAYLIESEYGRTIEAYRSTIAIDDNSEPRTVDFLRVGRVGLYYQTLDGAEQAQWNQTLHEWQGLDSKFRRGLNDGFRIARKQAAPQLLVLPVLSPALASAEQEKRVER